MLVEYELLLIAGALYGFAMVNLLGQAHLYEEIVHDLHLHDVAHLIALPFFIFGVAAHVRHETVKGGKLYGRKALLPISGAVGGMVVPFTLGWIAGKILGHNPWYSGSIATATDIAYALIAILRVPLHLKLFVMAAAIADDVGGIGVVTVVTGHGLDPLKFLLGSALTIGYTLGVRGIEKLSGKRLTPLYVFSFAGAWLFFNYAHAEMAIAFLLLPWLMPTQALKTFEHIFSIPTRILMGIFGFAMAGVSLQGAGAFSLGLYLAITIGKPLGFYWGVKVGEKVFRQQSGLSEFELRTGALAMTVAFTVSVVVSSLTFATGPVYTQAVIGSMATLLNIAITTAYYEWCRFTGKITKPDYGTVDL